LKDALKFYKVVEEYIFISIQEQPQGIASKKV